MITTKLVMVVILAMLVVYGAFSLIRRDRNATSKIDLEDLLIGEDGRLSKAAAIMMGAFGMTTWLMVYLATTGKMTEGYLAIYVGAWIAPTVVRLITNRPTDTVATTETSTTSMSKTVTPGVSHEQA